MIIVLLFEPVFQLFYLHLSKTIVNQKEILGNRLNNIVFV